ncbi:ribonuclease E/G [Aliishimia ponticola]|uniref:Ribonuclease E n=1 Tax=Aliishimia ponticola TaxID=2499833 RepID=A0A4S4NGD6_9RHOB|nr:ribonuclease E/G [Aliishimia ponticola]THH38694.1 ribonuclease E/G [Aliishimia ponticola]
MAKKMLIDATHAEETRVVVVDGNKVEEFDFESENKRQLAGNIYLAKVTRVEPSLQAAFVDYGGNRHGFLAFSEIHPDYYQIPVADREALMEEERAYAEAQRARDEEEETKPKRKSRSRSRSKAAKAKDTDAVAKADVASQEIEGMQTIDLDDGGDDGDAVGTHMDTVKETPVDTPAADEAQSEDTQSDEASSDTTVAEDAAAADAAPADETAAEAETSDEDDHADNGEDDQAAADASARDDSIESVAEEDDSEDIRPARKPRPRRYKIQEVIKVRQILLVQVVKEERGNKGAALTTYLSLAGRYCVLMPNTARGGGISRKITNAADRKKLKEIANEIEVPQGAGLIVRTAGAKRTKAEIKRDYEYLQRLWEQIRELTLKSIAPAKIYEEGDLIKRSIRDLYNREIDEVFVEGERGYRIAKDFMKMIMPSHAKNVKRYEDSLPLFARYQVESYLAAMFNPTVQLKSGGYIVIGVTEALVAIDVNSGRATKEGSIEETALKTNLEAADEVARQLRLRDLAGLIVIDFIDMDERKNNSAVEKRLKDKLKTDRARIQVGRISGFGLMEMSRQRLRPGMLEASTQPCPSCHGTGLIRSDDSMALSILRQIEEEGTRRRSREVLVTCPVGIANFLMNSKREHIAQIEARYGLSVRVEGDPRLISPDFTLEKFKTATRTVPEAEAPVVSADATIMEGLDEETEAEADADEAPSTNDARGETGEDGEAKPKRRRRRRRRRKSSSSDAEGNENGSDGSEAEAAPDSDAKADSDDAAKDGAAAKSDADAEAEPTADAEPDAEEKPKKRTRSTRSSRSKSKTAAETAKADAPAANPGADGASQAEAQPDADVQPETVTQEPVAEAAAEEKPKKPARTTRSRAKKKEPVAAETMAVEAVADPVAEAPADAAPEPVVEPVAETPAAEVEVASAPEPQPEPVAAEPEAEASAKPKRRGWWSLGSK